MNLVLFSVQNAIELLKSIYGLKNSDNTLFYKNKLQKNKAEISKK